MTEAQKAARREAGRRYRERYPEKERERWTRYRITHPRSANPEKAREYDRQYRAKNLDKKREQNKHWHVLHEEEKRQRRRKWIALHRDHKRATDKEWMAANPDKVRNYRSRQRARRAKAEGTYTEADVRQQRDVQQGECYYCKAQLGESRASYHADHFYPLARGGINAPENIVVACARCNLRKRHRDPHEFLANLPT